MRFCLNRMGIASRYTALQVRKMLGCRSSDMRSELPMYVSVDMFIGKVSMFTPLAFWQTG